MAHLAAAGSYAMSTPQYSYEIGPDGNAYAVGGEVKMDVSGEVSPEKTIEKAKSLRRAAMAPLHPSAQDFAAVTAVNSLEAQASRQIREEQAQQAELRSQSQKETGGENQPLPSLSLETPAWSMNKNPYYTLQSSISRQTIESTQSVISTVA